MNQRQTKKNEAAESKKTKQFLRSQSNILETAGGEMPDPSARCGVTAKETQASFVNKSQAKSLQDPKLARNKSSH